MKDFFISYNQEDRTWAEWIAVALEKAHYTVTIQDWDFLPGSNFVLNMQHAAVECERTIAVLSPDWLASLFTQPEWAAAFSLDPTGTGRKLVPVRVRACEPPGLLRSIVYCDLVGLSEEDAWRTLIQAVSGVRSRPDFVDFPGATAETYALAPVAPCEAFPGSRCTLPLDRLPPLVRCAFDLLGLVRTTRTTFEAQVRLRDRLVQRIYERLILNPYEYLEYEEFFARYFSKLDGYERQVFATIRSFTATVLRDYNRRILEAVDSSPQLKDHVGSVTELQNHLLLWLAKFDGTFLNTPEMCLLYVGVEEGVPFPKQVEMEIWEYLKQQRKTDELLCAEPNPPSEFEERWSGDGHWQFSLHRKWLLKRIKEIDGERNRVRGADFHVGDSRDTSPQHNETLRQLDQQLAEVLHAALFPGMCLETIVTREMLVGPLQDLIQSRDGGWPADLRAALSASEAALAQSSFFWTFRDILPLLPTLAFYVDVLGLGNDLSIVWQRLRDELKDWAIDHNTDRPYQYREPV